MPNTQTQLPVGLREKFEEKFLSFRDPDIVDGFAKEEILHFIAQELARKDEEIAKMLQSLKDRGIDLNKLTWIEKE